jgi:hypothetical protein
MTLLLGYTGVLCAATGQHHFIYYYDWEARNRLHNHPHLQVLQPMKLAKDSLDFYLQVKGVA